MKKILNELNEAFVLLSTISVAGDAVDAMAAAKTVLRNVFGELKEMETAGAVPSSGPPKAGHLPPEGEGLGNVQPRGEGTV